ncbi:hypothetical protein ES702_00194 [subsurface metagenome]
MSIRPVRASVAEALIADLIRRTASVTSDSSTVAESRILACASERRIMDSSWRVVAVMRRSVAWMLLPRLRIATYASVRAVAAGWVRAGWQAVRAWEMYRVRNSTGW